MKLVLLDNNEVICGVVEGVEGLVTTHCMDGGHTYLSLTPKLRESIINMIHAAYYLEAYQKPEPKPTATVLPFKR